MPSDALRPITEAQLVRYNARQIRHQRSLIARLQVQMPYQPRWFRYVDPEIADDMITETFEVGPDDVGDESNLHGYG